MSDAATTRAIRSAFNTLKAGRVTYALARWFGRREEVTDRLGLVSTIARWRGRDYHIEFVAPKESAHAGE